MNAATELPNYSLAPALGSVSEATVFGVDVDVAGTDDCIVTDTSVTIRQARGIPGWVGTIDCDLTAYASIKLELRRPGSTTDCALLFTVGGGVQGRTLIRDTKEPSRQSPWPANDFYGYVRYYLSDHRILWESFDIT